MTLDELYAHWRRLGAYLRENCPDVYEMVYDKFLPLEQEGDELLLGAESDYSARWYMDAFGRELEQGIKAVFGRSLTLAFEYGHTPSESDLAQFGFHLGEGSAESGSASKNLDSAVGKTAENAVQGLACVSNRYATAENCLKENTFANFVRGEENRYALAAAEVTVKTLCTYNPLYIYSGPGMGKTHLIQAIANELYRRDKSKRIRYATCEEFLNDYLNAIRNHGDFKFREKYRDIDVLLIDDVQFLSNKFALQEEFFNTFNALYNAGRQIVFTSDRPPVEIEGLEERLVSRFQSGLTLQITQSTYATRLGVLELMHSKMKTEIPHDVLEFLATNITTNFRPLKNALTRLALFTSSGVRMDVEMAKSLLADILDRRDIEAPVAGEIDAGYVQKVVAQHYRLKASDLTGKKRTRDIAFPRMVAMYLCRKCTSLSQQEIGQSFGGRTHATVIHAIRQVEDLCASDEGLKHDLETLSAHFSHK